MLPTRISEVDFEGNPTATFHDTLFFDNDCQSYWRFNDDASLADDKELSDGTFGGAPTLVAGLLPLDDDEALSFDGVDDYASVPTTSALQQSGSWTLEGLLRFDTGALPGALKPLCTKGAFHVEIRADNMLQFTVQNHVAGTSTRTTVVGTTPIEEERAYHVECIHDAVAQELRIVLNGRVEATAPHTAGTELWGLPLLFAARHSGTAPAFGTVGAILGHGGGDPTATWAPTAPASIAVDDLLLAHFYTTSNGAAGGTWTLPSGWTALLQQPINSGQSMVMIAYKFAEAGDVGAASYTFTKTGTNASLTQGQAAIARYTGVDTAQPFANPPYLVEGNSVTAATGDKYSQADDVLTLGLANMSRSVAWTSSDGTERYDTGGTNTPGKAIACYTSTLSDQTVASKFDMTSNGTGNAWAAVWLSLKGPDAQDFCEVELGQWALLARALDDDEALDHSEARSSGVGTWTDISSDSKMFDFERGRQYELDRIEAAVLRETLKDANRDYDPSNTDGLYYPNVKTKRRHRIRATVGAETFPLYQGLVERWPQQWLAPAYQEIALTASDGMAALALAPVSGTIESGLAGAQLHRLLDFAGWPRADRAIDEGQFLMEAWGLQGEKALPSIQELVDSELGLFFISADGIATFHDYAHRWTAARSLNVQATFSDVEADIDAGAIPYLFGGVDPSYDDDTTINEWTVSTADDVSVTVRDVIGSRQAFTLADSRPTRLVSIVDAETQALALLQHTARAGQRFDKITVSPRDETRWATILGLEISDRVRFVHTPSVGSQIVEECFVESIGIEQEPGDWTVSFGLSPVSPASFYETAIRSGPRSYYRLNEVT